MKKLFVFLIFVVCCSSIYLYKVIDEKNYYTLPSHDDFFIIQIKDLEEIDKNTFNINNYFKIISIESYSLRYEFIDDILKITIISTNKKEDVFEFKVSFMAEKIVERIIYKEKEIPIHNEGFNEDRAIPNDSRIKTFDEFYFEGYKDIAIPLNSSLEELVYQLSKDIVSNANVTIYYADVNLSKTGTYTVTYFVNERTYQINVNVYW